MGSNWYCTYFDRGYLSRGVVMIRSLLDTQPDLGRIVVLALDSETRERIEGFGDDRIRCIEVEDLFSIFPDLREARHNRSRTEFIWTLTPCLCRHLLEGLQQDAWLYYVDADLCFYSSCSEIQAESQTAQVVIHKQNFTPILRDLERNGKYNVGLVGFRNEPAALAILERWVAQCIASCAHDPVSGRCGDQQYLDEWPAAGPEVHVIETPGVGVAPWNVGNYLVGGGASSPTVNGQKVIFYHFHGLRQYRFLPCILAYRYHIGSPVKSLFYKSYLEALRVEDCAGFELSNRVSVLQSIREHLLHFPFRNEWVANCLLSVRSRLLRLR